MQKNMQEVQSLMMGAEPPVQKTYIVEIEPRLKSKFVLTENAKNLSAEPIIYVSQKERQQQTAYQTQNTQTVPTKQTVHPVQKVVQSEEQTLKEQIQNYPQQNISQNVNIEQKLNYSPKNMQSVQIEPATYPTLAETEQITSYQQQNYDTLKQENYTANAVQQQVNDFNNNPQKQTLKQEKNIKRKDILPFKKKKDQN